MYEKLFVKGKIPKGGSLLKPLIYIRGYRCEKCGLSEWEGSLIPLEVHHVEQDRTNSELKNLQLLCCNCHAQTDSFSKSPIKEKVTNEELAEALKNCDSIHQALLSVNLSTTGVQYARANQVLEMYNIPNPKEKNGIQQIYYCIDCKKTAVFSKGNRCRECSYKAKRIVERPDRETFKEMIRTKTFTEMSKIFKVSDATIRQCWTKFYNLPNTKKQINSLTDEEWLNI